MAIKKQHITTSELGEQPVWRLLMRYSLPAIVGTTVTSLYNLTDSIFIGNGVGPMAMSGLGVTMPIMSLISAVGSMIGAGAASLASLRLGEKDKRSADVVLGNVMTLNLLVAIITLVAGLFFLEPILRLFGTPEGNVMMYAKEYLRILLIGNLVTNSYLSLGEMLRASGYPRKAMMVMLLAVALNIVFDALFIFYFKWGIAGSAYATILAQMIALVVELVHFGNCHNFIHFEWSAFPLKWNIVKRIVVIGSAPCLLHVCASVVTYVVNNALKVQGDLYIGTYSVVSRVVMLFIMIITGFHRGMQPIVGFNYGAKNFGRVKQTLRLTIYCGMATALVGCLVCEFFPTWIASLFVNTKDGDVLTQLQNKELMESIEHAIRVVFIIFPVSGFQIVTSNFFQYIGKSYKSIILSFTRQLVLLIPLLLLLPMWWGNDGVWMSFPIADGTAALIAAVVLYAEIRGWKENSETLK